MELSKLKKHTGTIIAIVIIPIIGIVSPIIWEWWKGIARLELVQLASITIADKNDNLNNLQILYNNIPIERVSKISFLLINTGKKPIEGNQLISPPTIVFPEAIKILELIEENKSPKNLSVKFDIDTSMNTIKILFPLLNPNDNIQFSLLVNGKSLKYDAYARIVGIKELVVKNSTSDSNNTQKHNKNHWLFWVSLLGFFGTLWLFQETYINYRQVILFKKSLLSENQPFPKNMDKNYYFDYIESNLPFLSGNDYIKILGFLNSVEDEAKLTENQQLFVQQNLINYLNKNDQGKNLVLWGLYLLFVTPSVIILGIDLFK